MSCEHPIRENYAPCPCSHCRATRELERINAERLTAAAIARGEGRLNRVAEIFADGILNIANIVADSPLRTASIPEDRRFIISFLTAADLLAVLRGDAQLLGLPDDARLIGLFMKDGVAQLAIASASYPPIDQAADVREQPAEVKARGDRSVEFRKYT